MGTRTARTPSPEAARRRRLAPDRWLPVAYFTFAHLCLALACAAIAWDARALGGFFYHPRLIAVVHLVTLGWISGSILGALYMLGPMVLRTPMPAGRGDRWVFAAFAVGTLGMVSHFWIDEPRGMAWAAVLVLAALVLVGGKLVAGLRRSGLPRESRLHFELATANVVLAGVLGLLAGIDKFWEVLPGFVLHNVFAHAHLAAIGWGTLMVMAAGYRLLPMMLPAAMPAGRPLWWSAVLTEAGVLGLAGSWLLGAGGRPLFALLCVAGVGVFLDRVRWMLARRRPAPPALRRPDLGTLQAFVALACLVAAAALGLWLALAPPPPWWPAAALVYGALGLVGFLGQMVVGVSARLFPLFAWISRVGGRLHERPPPSPHDLPRRRLQAAVAGLWLVGLPCLVAGLGGAGAATLRAGGTLLGAAALVGLLGQILVLADLSRASASAGR